MRQRLPRATPDETGKEMAPSNKGPEMAPRSPKGQFLPGTIPNPNGRPKGSLNESSRVALSLLTGEAEAISRKAVDLALAGDVQALRLVLERLIPPARERALSVELPALKSATDLPAAVSRILGAVAEGEITPTEGERLAGLLGAWRESLEFAELEARIAALEGRR